MNLTNDERIALIKANLPGDFYRLHLGAQQNEWERTARELRVAPR